MKPDIKQINNINSEATFSTPEAARLLGCTRQAIIHRIEAGTIRATKVCGRWYVSGQAIKNQVADNGKGDV